MSEGMAIILVTVSVVCLVFVLGWGAIRIFVDRRPRESGRQHR